MKAIFNESDIQINHFEILLEKIENLGALHSKKL
jgi:hypothetical protein